jgi:ureidoacrylate peracid hydrolase
VKPQDLRVRKRRFSAFIQGSSDLEAILRSRGIDTLIITGTTPTPAVRPPRSMP